MQSNFAALRQHRMQQAIDSTRALVSDDLLKGCGGEVIIVAMDVLFPQTGQRKAVATALFGEDVCLEELAEDYAYDDDGRPGVIETVQKQSLN